MNDQRILVLTDSGTDTPAAFAAEHDVRIVPLRINYSDGTSYESGVDISAEEVVRRFDEEIPKTSLPSPAKIREVLATAHADGYERAVFVPISSGLSATAETVRLIASQMPDFPTIVNDTRSIGAAAGLCVMEAVRKIEAGIPFESLADVMEQVARNTSVFFAVKNLKYLRAGGRISEALYHLGSVLSIKPVIKCDERDGHYVLAKKARGWERALEAEVKLAIEKARAFDRVRLCVCCSEATAVHFDQLEHELRERIPAHIVDVVRSGISADLLVHTGPDLVGVAVQGV